MSDLPLARDLILLLLDRNPDLMPEQLALLANCSEETAAHYRNAWLAQEEQRERDARRRRGAYRAGVTAQIAGDMYDVPQVIGESVYDRLAGDEKGSPKW